MRWVLIGGGILMLLVGAVWVLQGVGILLGSFMTGQPFWATVGLILIICGAVACFFGVRRKPSNPQV